MSEHGGVERKRNPAFVPAGTIFGTPTFLRSKKVVLIKLSFLKKVFTTTFYEVKRRVVHVLTTFIYSCIVSSYECDHLMVGKKSKGI